MMKRKLSCGTLAALSCLFVNSKSSLASMQVLQRPLQSQSFFPFEEKNHHQTLILDADEKGTYFLNLSRLDTRFSGALTLRNRHGQILGKVQNHFGNVTLTSQGEHDFCINDIEDLRSFSVDIKGSLIAETPLWCADKASFSVGGKAVFKKGIEVGKGPLNLNSGHFEFDGLSQVSAVILDDTQSFTILDQAVMKADVVITQVDEKEGPKTVGPVQIFGQLQSEVVSLDTKGFQVGYDGRFTSRSYQQLSPEGTFENLGFFETSSFMGAMKSGVNAGQMSVKENITLEEASWENQKGGVLAVGQLFKANLVSYIDEGKSIFSGFAMVDAEEGYIGGHTTLANGIFNLNSDFAVHESATFDVGSHLSLRSSQGDIILDGIVQVDSQHSTPNFSEVVQDMTANLTPGIFVGARKDVIHKGAVLSSNTPVTFVAETGKFTDSGGHTQSGFFEGNLLQISAEDMAELLGTLYVQQNAIVTAKSATLKGRRSVRKAFQLSVKEDIQQEKEDLQVAGTTIFNGKNVTLAGFIRSTNATLVRASETTETKETSQIRDGDVVIESVDTTLGGKINGEGKFVTTGTRKDGNDGGTNEGKLTFKSSFKVKSKSQYSSAKTIVHEDGSEIDIQEDRVEKAQDKLHLQKGARTGARNSQLDGGENLIIEGEENNRENTSLKGKKATIAKGGRVKSGKATYAKIKEGFSQFGAMDAENTLLEAGLWVDNRGSINSRKSCLIDTERSYNWFRGNIKAGESLSIMADLGHVSLFSNLSAKNTEINAGLFNANLFSRQAGSESLTVNAIGANIGLGGLYHSDAYTSNALLNINEVTLIGAFYGVPLQVPVALPSSKKGIWDSDKAFYDQNLFRMGLSLASQVVTGHLKTAARASQIAFAARDIAKGFGQLYSLSSSMESEDWMRPSRIAKVFGTGFSLAMSTRRLGQSAHGLYNDVYTPIQGPNPAPIPFWQRATTAVVNAVGPTATINSIWDFSGSHSYALTGHLSRNSYNVIDHSHVYALTKSINTHTGSSTGTTRAYSSTTQASGSFTLNDQTHLYGGDHYVSTGGDLNQGNDFRSETGLGFFGTGTSFYESGGNFETAENAATSSNNAAKVTARGNINHKGAFHGDKGVSMNSSEGDVTLVDGSSLGAGNESVVHVTAEKGKVTIDPDVDFSGSRQSDSSKTAPIFVFKGRDVESRGKFHQVHSLFFEGEKSLLFGRAAYHDVQNTFSLKAPGSLHYPGSIVTRGQRLLWDHPGTTNLIDLIGQKGHYSNFHFPDYAKITVPYAVTFQNSMTPASRSLELNAGAISLVDNVSVSAPGILTMRAETGNFSVGAGSSIAGGMFTDIYAYGDIIGYHSLAPYNWTSGKEKGQIRGANFSHATFSGGDGIDYAILNSGNGETAETRQMGLRVCAGGRIRGTGMIFNAGGDVILDGEQGYHNDGLAQQYLDQVEKEVTEIEGERHWWSCGIRVGGETCTEYKYHYDTNFYDGNVSSQNGRVQIYSAKGGFHQTAGSISAQNGIRLFVRDDIATPALTGRKGQGPLNNWKSLAEVHRQSTFKGPVMHISKKGNIHMPGLVLEAPNSPYVFQGNDVLFSRIGMEKKSQKIKIGFNADGPSWDRGGKKGLAGFLTALKNVTSMGVNLDLTYDSRGRTWAGSGRMVVGSLYDLGGSKRGQPGQKLSLLNGYDVFVLGDAYLNRHEVIQKGFRETFYDRHQCDGRHLRLKCLRPQVGVHYDYKGTKGHSYRPGFFTIRGDLSGHAGHWTQDAARVEADSASINIGCFDSRTRQTVSRTKVAGVDVSLDILKIFLGEVPIDVSLYGTPDRIFSRQTPKIRSGLFVKRANEGFSAGSVNLRGARFDIKSRAEGSYVGPIHKSSLAREYDRRGNVVGFNLSFSDIKTGPELASIGASVTHMDRGHSYTVSGGVSFGENPDGTRKTAFSSLGVGYDGLTLKMNPSALHATTQVQMPDGNVVMVAPSRWNFFNSLGYSGFSLPLSQSAWQGMRYRWSQDSRALKNLGDHMLNGFQTFRQMIHDWRNSDFSEIVPPLRPQVEPVKGSLYDMVSDSREQANNLTFDEAMGTFDLSSDTEENQPLIKRSLWQDLTWYDAYTSPSREGTFSGSRPLGYSLLGASSREDSLSGAASGSVAFMDSLLASMFPFSCSGQERGTGQFWFAENSRFISGNKESGMLSFSDSKIRFSEIPAESTNGVSKSLSKRASLFFEQDPRFFGTAPELFKNHLEFSVNARVGSQTIGNSLGEGILGGTRVSLRISLDDVSQIFPRKGLCALRETPLGSGYLKAIPEVVPFQSPSSFIGTSMGSGQYYTLKGMENIVFDDLRAYPVLQDLFKFSYERAGTIYGPHVWEKMPLSIHTQGARDIGGFYRYNSRLGDFIGINLHSKELLLPKSGLSNVEVYGFSHADGRLRFISETKGEMVNVLSSERTFTEELFHRAWHRNFLPKEKSIATNNVFQCLEKDFSQFTRGALGKFGDSVPYGYDLFQSWGDIPSEFLVERYLFSTAEQQFKSGMSASLVAEEYMARLAVLKEAGVDIKKVAPSSSSYLDYAVKRFNEDSCSALMPNESHLARNGLPHNSESMLTSPETSLSWPKRVGQWWHGPVGKGIRFTGRVALHGLDVCAHAYEQKMFDPQIDCSDAFARGLLPTVVDTGIWGGIAAVAGGPVTIGLGLVVAAGHVDIDSKYTQTPLLGFADQHGNFHLATIHHAKPDCVKEGLSPIYSSQQSGALMPLEERLIHDTGKTLGIALHWLREKGVDSIFHDIGSYRIQEMRAENPDISRSDAARILRRAFEDNLGGAIRTVFAPEPYIRSVDPEVTEILDGARASNERIPLGTRLYIDDLRNVGDLWSDLP